MAEHDAGITLARWRSGTMAIMMGAARAGEASRPPAHTAAPRPAADPPPPAVAPPPGNPRFALVDSLRAVAALGVLLGHVGALSGAIAGHWWGQALANGDQGVTVFFIISGFLLYRPFVAARGGDAPPVRLRDYARRRVLRIVPAYWLALTLLAIYPGLVGVFTHNWWRYYLFLQVYTPATGLGGLVQAWTLCIEVSFYLVLPLYALAMGRVLRSVGAQRRVTIELAVLASLASASVVTRYAVSYGPVHGALPGYLYWFALGMALAVISAVPAGPGVRRALTVAVTRRPGLCWSVALALYVVMALTLHAPNNLSGYPRLQEVLVHHVLGGAFAFFLVLPAVLGAQGGGWPRRVLGWRVLAWLGLISYGIYLWQGNASDWLAAHGLAPGLGPFGSFPARAAGTIVLATGAAAVSYYALERPILRLKYARRRSRRS